MTIEPYVVFGTKVKIGNNFILNHFHTFEGTKIEKNVEVGPYARVKNQELF